MANRLRHFVHNGWFSSQKYSRPDFLARVRADVLRICRRESIGLIFVDGLEGAQYVPEEYQDLAVLDLCDTPSSFYERTTKLQSHSWSRRFALRRATRAVRSEETYWIRKLPLTLVISEVEKAAVCGHAPSEKVRVIGNGTDSDYFHAEATRPRTGMYVFLGVMDFFPNLDGASHFIKDIFPHIRSLDSGAMFYVVGKGPPPDLLAENGKEGVVVTGEVEDVRPWLAQAEAFLCPLRVGAGVKNKVLAAMAMKVPVVCSRLSLEGIDALPGVHLLVADTADEYVSALRLLRASPARRQAIVEAAHLLVIQKHAWISKGVELNQAVEDVLRPEEPRVKLLVQA